MAVQPHFLLFPFMAQGHMIPMVDFGRLLARRGIIVTFLTTPLNAARFRPIIDRDQNSGLRISFLEIDFPTKQSGLPEGVENQDQLPPSISESEFMAATLLLEEPVEMMFDTIKPPPSCIVSDILMPFTMNIARKFNVPRISFYVFNCFSSVVMHKAQHLLQTLESEDEKFIVPDIPDRIEINKRQSLSSSGADPIPDSMQDYPIQVYRSEMSSYGTVVNTFVGMEAEYVKLFASTRKKVYCVGPVSLCNTDYLDMVQRGKKAAVDDDICLKWLDSQAPNSVIYISFGSLYSPVSSQLIELALGLEASNRAFIWAIKGGSENEELKKWAAENGYEERVKGRGFMIWGWAPQVLILSHSAIGGFLNHCGSSALLEGICMGVPMLTWPLAFDQFTTERLVVDVLRIGVSAGVRVPANGGREVKWGDLVKREEVKAAIDGLMEEGEESRERRGRVRELAEKAKRAVAEGGSSDIDISKLIKDMISYHGS